MKMLTSVEKQDLQFKLMSLAQQAQSTAMRIEVCQKLITAIGKEAFAMLLNIGTVYNPDNSLIDSSFFSFIASTRARIDSAFMDFLLANGANAHLTYRTIEDNGKRRINLFHLCAKYENAALYQYLISRKITPLNVMSTDEHVLAFVTESLNFDFFKMVIGSLSSFDSEEKCLTHLDESGNNIFNLLFKYDDKLYEIAFLYEKHPELYVKTTLNENDFKLLARSALYHPAKCSLHRVIFAHPLFQTLYARIEQLCLANLLTDNKTALFTRTVHASFKEPLKQLDAKHPGMRAVMVRYYSILANPNTVKALLAKLSTELSNEIARAGLTNAFENPSTAFSYEAVHHYLYPIPHAEYRKIDKQAILTELLLKILRTADMGKRATKWVGFIPAEIANQRIHAGDLFVESQFGIGIFHGKYAHMLQWVILIYAINAGVFADLVSQDAKFIIQCLVTTKTQDNNYFWALAIDSLSETYTFADPYRLTSYLTTGGFGAACKTLEIYCRDSFCDSYLQWLNAYNQCCTDTLSPQNFAKLNAVSNIANFAFTPYLIEAHYTRDGEKVENPDRKRLRHSTLFRDHESDISMIIEKTPRPQKI